MNAELLTRVTRRIVATVSEMNYAQRRLTELRLGLGSYVIEPDEPPATYHEFLARCHSRPLHEPSANERGRGKGDIPRRRW